VQPAQLSLLPDQVPAPPPTLLAQLPEPRIAEAITLLARLIAKASVQDITTTGNTTPGWVSGGE
jgi:hypothetical protein